MTMAWIDHKKVYILVPQSWIVDCLKMYKISEKFMKFITEAMKKIEWGIGSWGKNFIRGKNPERHLPGRCAVAITICNSNDATQLQEVHGGGGYKFTKTQEKINHPMYKNEIMLFAEKENNWRASDANNKNIQPKCMNGIWHRKVCNNHNEKWKVTNNGRNRTAKSRKNQNFRRKGKLQVLGNIGSDYHQNK